MLWLLHSPHLSLYNENEARSPRAHPKLQEKEVEVTRREKCSFPADRRPSKAACDQRTCDVTAQNTQHAVQGLSSRASFKDAFGSSACPAGQVFGIILFSCDRLLACFLFICFIRVMKPVFLLGAESCPGAGE